MVGFRFYEVSHDYGTRAGPGATLGGASRCAAANHRDACVARRTHRRRTQARIGAHVGFFGAWMSNPTRPDRRHVVAAR
ncbi:hypothetical protein DR62_07420 [Burkholderia thailandensis]|uniref:Uncharacterized protein n=1 Tax=Burkholderia thailandensis TaxID=57975 RepID=A0AAW9CY65_BURTH|nr:hypothetical protein DR62_07420 [Burkholderia thailandensis]AOI54909.1 hypothetical protein WI24_24225 [Burkholderia thailandensis]MDD1484385.1 hypothetical protein [Burkholderia thailandensis]MDD1490467.1 hypothetical protein [Burkholderia thailandensis]MDD1496532.1 hypothetical protein [Burkholderia thailandensis]